MSTAGGLSRTRSLRQPPTRGDELGKRGADPSSSTRNEPRTNFGLTRSATSSTTTTTSSSTTSRTRAAGSTANTSRPPSAAFSGKNGTGRRPSPTTTSSENAGTTTTKPLGRAPSTRQSPTAMMAENAGNATTKPLTRASSMRQPTATLRASTTSTGAAAGSGRPRTSSISSSTTTASKPRQVGHSRAKSTVTGPTAATALRPASTQGTSTTAGASTPTSNSMIPSATQTKPQTRSQTHARTQSHPSQPAQNRPAFNTLQQHYSPAKSLAPKPLTSAFLAPPTPSKLPANVAISAETARLQTELLQLSLLHRDAAAVDADWRASAEQKLGDRFARLAGENARLARDERERAEGRNAAALARWADVGENGPGKAGGVGVGVGGLGEKVQLLDEVLGGVWSLGEPGGRYARVVRAFEAWAEGMADILAAQRNGDVGALVGADGGGGGVMFLSELDCGWRGECAGLARKLDGWRASLGELGGGDVLEEPPDEQGRRSGLARILEGCRSLVRDMLAELDVMEQIWRDAAAAENEWIERMNGKFKVNSGDTPGQEVPLWKMVA
ncbi:hypothetical protein DL762_009822 [Monosporascus cannonballus]|uniref:AGA1 A-agglutinin anchor subunit n=1 Tax=Monosporascus cannonballus TaxID=155416 RepID=A0ABY0GSM4_9PEZI|nr:hypothetical protein DL762_009822 [Monosporascus cannonballus]